MARARRKGPLAVCVATRSVTTQTQFFKKLITTKIITNGYN